MADLDGFEAWLEERIARLSDPERIGRAYAVAAANLIDDYRREQTSIHTRQEADHAE